MLISIENFRNSVEVASFTAGFFASQGEEVTVRVGWVKTK
jgi:hypothetical protein